MLPTEVELMQKENPDKKEVIMCIKRNFKSIENELEGNPDFECGKLGIYMLNIKKLFEKL